MEEIKTKKRFSPATAALLNFLWPGIGYIYLGEITWGLILAILIIPLLCIAVGFLIWPFVIWHGYILAKEKNE